jgi:hypothetical protein
MPQTAIHQKVLLPVNPQHSFFCDLKLDFHSQVASSILLLKTDNRSSFNYNSAILLRQGIKHSNSNSKFEKDEKRESLLLCCSYGLFFQIFANNLKSQVIFQIAEIKKNRVELVLLRRQQIKTAI